MDNIGGGIIMKQVSKLFTVNLTYFVVVCLFVVVRLVNAFIDTSSVDTTLTDTIFTIVVEIVILFVIPVTIYTLMRKQKVGQTFKDFKFSKISPISILICILMGICCYILNLAVSAFFSGLIQLLGYEGGVGVSSGGSTVIDPNSVAALIINLVLVALLPAICEETTHRGMLLSGMKKMGVVRAIVYSSILFGLLHLNINQTFYAIVLGMIMAVSVVMSGSILPAMIIHFLNNGLSVYFAYAQQTGAFGGNFLPAIYSFLGSGNIIIVFILCLVFLIVIIGVLAALFYWLMRETQGKRINNLLKQVVTVTPEDSSTLKNMQKNKNAPLSGDYLKNITVLNEMLKKYGVHTAEDLFFGVGEKKQKPTPWENFFFYGSVFLAGLITIFTFIWGLI